MGFFRYHITNLAVNFRGFRTLAFSALTLIVSIMSMPEVSALVPTDKLPYVMAFVAIMTAVLRIDTKTPVGVSKVDK